MRDDIHDRSNKLSIFDDEVLLMIERYERLLQLYEKDLEDLRTSDKGLAFKSTMSSYLRTSIINYRMVIDEMRCLYDAYH